MSRAFSTNNGSGESLKVSARCGCKPKARQIRLPVALLRPARFASASADVNPSYWRTTVPDWKGANASITALWDRHPYYYKHATVVSLRRMLGPSEYDSYFRFTFVRNPWDWIVSQSSFNRGFSPPFVFDSPYTLRRRVLPEHEDWAFADWLPWWIGTFTPSQTQMLLCEDGGLDFDFIGRFERLHVDFRHVCDHLGIDALPLPHLEVSKHGAFRDFYKHETRRLVREHFRTDFALLGYSVDL